MLTANGIVTAVEWYLGVGLAVAVAFAALVGRVEPSARGGSFAFRLLILPGATLLWPLVAVRTVRALLRPAKKEHA